MESKKVFIYANDTEMSAKIEKLLRKKLVKSGLRVYEQLEADTALIICIGGDGTLLRCLRSCDFPTIPVVGINTGHLGFFQELMPDKIDDFIFQYQQGNFTVHSYSTVKSRVETSSGTMRQIALNEIAIKGVPNYPVQLNISINDSFIERFSGDGICVSTPAGSTAYNYSLGGAIVDPREPDAGCPDRADQHRGLSLVYFQHPAACKRQAFDHPLAMTTTVISASWRTALRRTTKTSAASNCRSPAKRSIWYASSTRTSGKKPNPSFYKNQKENYRLCRNFNTSSQRRIRTPDAPSRNSSTPVSPFLPA